MGRVLVVDDTEDSLDLVTDALEGLHDILHARTGAEGLALAKVHRPAVILLDMSLPEMDGWTVASRLKADPELAAIPVIAVTAHAMSGDRERCLKAGCNDYLSKPISVQTLVEVVTRHMQPTTPAVGTAGGREQGWE